jgi:hypothetical protein
MSKPLLIFSTFLLLFVFMSGCTSTPTSLPTPTQELTAAPTLTPHPDPTWTIPAPVIETSPVQDTASAIALTQQRLDGNRLVTGSGGMPTEPINIPLSGKPLWVVAAPVSTGSVWAAALEDGRVQAFLMVGDTVSEISLNVSELPAGMPPALLVVGEQITLISPAPDASPLTNPIALKDGAQAYIDMDGRLHLTRQGAAYSLEVDALPDARILSDGDGRLLFLSNPNSEYPHGVLGDAIEAKTITLVGVIDTPRVLRVIQIDPGDVIEGIAPIWVDLDGDGAREIIVTQSSARTGARLVVYREDGSLYASSEPIGQGFRWLHQLAVGQFIEGGSQEIVVIRTPHIGGIIEIYAVEGDKLVIQGILSGYSSHQIGSRNLDSAVAGDFDGNGRIEIVVPDQSQTALAGVEWAEAGLNIAWEAPLGGRLSTNIAAVELRGGGFALGIGHDQNLLRIWYPK